MAYSPKKKFFGQFANHPKVLWPNRSLPNSLTWIAWISDSMGWVRKKIPIFINNFPPKFYLHHMLLAIADNPINIFSSKILPLLCYISNRQQSHQRFFTSPP